MDEAAETLKATRLQFANAEALLERDDPPAPEILIFALNALADENAPADRITDAMVHNLPAQHLSAGYLPYGGIMRPPTADSPVTTAAFAMRAFRRYAPPARRAEYDERIARAARALSFRRVGDHRGRRHAVARPPRCNAKMAAGRRHPTSLPTHGPARPLSTPCAKPACPPPIPCIGKGSRFC